MAKLSKLKRSPDRSHAAAEKIRNFSERCRLARKARCDGEGEAIRHHGMEPGEAWCRNCGWKFPPQFKIEEKRWVWCATYRCYKSVNSFCRQWSHSKDTSAGIGPHWCEPYTKERKS